MNDHHPFETPPTLSEQTREWLTALLHGKMDVAIIFLNPNGTVADWLGGAERLFGHTKQEALGMPFSALFTEEDVKLGMHEQELAIARSSGRSEDDRWHVRKNLSRFWASGVLTAVRQRGDGGQADGELIAFCKIVRDRTDVLTHILALENQLWARTADIERRDRVATSVAHELLNPMVPIISAVALLKKSDDAAMRTRACEIIDRQVRLLKGLVDDLNDGARALRAHHLIAMERVSINEALRESADGLMSTAEGNGLSLLVVLPLQTIWISADPLRLQQMLLNLISNAIKFTPPGGHITLSVTVEEEMAVIRVEDDGRGISPAIIPLIFELFTREERSGPIPGMGVGLAVVQDLARRHGGSAEARSAGVGLGSMFAVRLPLFGSPRQQAGTAPASATASATDTTSSASS